MTTQTGLKIISEKPPIIRLLEAWKKLTGEDLLDDLNKRSDGD